MPTIGVAQLAWVTTVFAGSSVSSIAVVVLSAAIATAGVVKLLMPTGGHTLTAEFASRGRPYALSVALLPFVEIVLAVALVTRDSRRVGAFVCLILLATFSLVILTEPARMRGVPCGCFGSKRAKTKASALARNAGLMALSVVAAFSADRGVDTRVLALVVVAATGVAVSVLLARELREAASNRARDLSGKVSYAVDEALTTTDGATMTIRKWLTAGRVHVLVFVDPLCAPCRAVLPAVAIRQLASGPIGVAVLSRGPLAENDRLAREFGLAPIGVQAGDGVAHRFGINATPSAVVVSVAGVVVAGPVFGKTAVLELMDESFLARAS